MQVNQIYAILNDIMLEISGQVVPVYNEQGEQINAVPVVQEDLSNIVDVGTYVFNNNWRDNYVHSMINRIGREVFVDRTYEGYAPSVLRDAWEYGSVMAKTRCKIFEAKANPSWTLEKGQTVNQFEFNPPTVYEKFFNKKVGWQIDCSFTEVQLRESFTNATAMNRFYSMIENRIATSMTIYTDSLVMRTINNFMAEKMYANNGVIDLLAGYNEGLDTPITAAAAMRSKEFLRYAALTISLFVDRFRAPSANFNIMDGDDMNITFTPREYAHLVLHSDLAKAMEVYLQSDTYHDELVKIGEYETVPFWQLQGDKYQLANTSRIDVKLASDNTHTIDRNYVVGVLFDRDALGVMNDNRRTTNSYNANGEYWNNFYKVDTSYFNDLAENGIIFVLGNGTIPTITLSAQTATVTLPNTKATITATVSPAGSTVTWKSSDTSKASVSNGTISPTSAGTCTVTASITVDGVTYTADCAVTVEPAPAEAAPAEAAPAKSTKSTK